MNTERLAEIRLFTSLLAKEAARPGGAYEAVVLAQLESIFGDGTSKTAGIGDIFSSMRSGLSDAYGSVKDTASSGVASLKELWPSVRSNVIGGLAGGAVMGGVGYGMTNRIPGESDAEFSSRRRRFALTSGIGGMAVGAAAPTVMKSTGLDKKVEGVWNEATMTPEDRAARASAEAAAQQGQVSAQAGQNATAVAGLGATVGAASSLHKTDEHFKSRQDAFKGKTDAMSTRRTELERIGTDRAGQIKANLDTAASIGAADAGKASIAEAQKAVQTASAALKNIAPGNPAYTTQQAALQKAQQRLGSLQGQAPQLQARAGTARAVEAWLAGKSSTAPSAVPAADAKFITRNQGEVSKLTDRLANRGAGPTRAGTQTARTVRNTALGTVLGLISPHLWNNAKDAVPAINNVTGNPAK